MVYLELYGSNSHCCNVPSRIVLGRKGGFVFQICIKCGKPGELSKDDLPRLICTSCNRDLQVYIKRNKNYAYQCVSCDMSTELADLVPPWSALEGNKEEIYATKLRTFGEDSSENTSDYDSIDNTDSCEAHERIYGDKYLGIVARERDGHYGSICLYDDYGEESEA